VREAANFAQRALVPHRPGRRTAAACEAGRASGRCAALTCFPETVRSETAKTGEADVEKKRFSKEQIIAVLKDSEAGAKLAHLCRKIRIRRSKLESQVHLGHCHAGITILFGESHIQKMGYGGEVP
jgi:hypothetical protein